MCKVLPFICDNITKNHGLPFLKGNKFCLILNYHFLFLLLIFSVCKYGIDLNHVHAMSKSGNSQKHQCLHGFFFKKRLNNISMLQNVNGEL